MSSGFFAELLRDMKRLPPLTESPARAEVPATDRPRLSLLIPARNAADTIERTLREAQLALSAICGDSSFEIVAVPNPKPGDLADRTEEVIRSLGAELPSVVIAPHQRPPGKGAALRTGFLASRGASVFYTDADLPYDLDFVARALPLLEGGSVALVSGNRRLDSSEVNVPVELLPLSYGRHRLGLLFNRFMRIFLPLRTTDTQSGMKGMCRELAEKSFRRQICPGFFFDLEIFLTASAKGLRHAELPIVLRLDSEKSTIRLVKEAVLTIWWILRIRLHLSRGGYQK